MGRKAAKVRPDFTSRQRLDRAIRESDFDVETRAILWCFMAYVNQPTGLDEVWVAVSRLHAETGMFKDRIERRIAVLIERGWFEVVQVGSGRRPTSYRIVLPGSLSADGPDATSSADNSLLPDGPDTNDGQNVAVASGPGPVASGRSARSVRTIGRERKNEGTTPLPPGRLPRALVDVLRREGVSSTDDMTRVVEISSSDPETVVAASRLESVPHHRKQCVEQMRADKARERARVRDSLPKCPVCSLLVSECDAQSARSPGWCDGPDLRAAARKESA